MNPTPVTTCIWYWMSHWVHCILHCACLVKWSTWAWVVAVTISTYTWIVLSPTLTQSWRQALRSSIGYSAILGQVTFEFYLFPSARWSSSLLRHCLSAYVARHSWLDVWLYPRRIHTEQWFYRLGAIEVSDSAKMYSKFWGRRGMLSTYFVRKRWLPLKSAIL